MKHVVFFETAEIEVKMSPYSINLLNQLRIFKNHSNTLRLVNMDCKNMACENGLSKYDYYLKVVASGPVSKETVVVVELVKT
jgi:hypothetical protein